MYTMDIRGKNDIVTTLVMECLLRYAKGFFCADPQKKKDPCEWLDVSLLKKASARPKSPFCVESYKFNSKTVGSLALLVPSETGFLCRAGGVGLTFLTEWVLDRYIARYADCLGDDCSNREAHFENMRERVEAILKRNAAIRCCKVNHFYTGYVTSNSVFGLGRNENETDSEYQSRVTKTIRDNELFLAPKKASDALKVYQFTQDVCNMNVYMLDQCFDEQNQRVNKQNIPYWAKQAPTCLQPDRLLPSPKQGWQMLSDKLELSDGRLYFTPVSKMYEGQYLTVMAGQYTVAWHSCDGTVDAVALVRNDLPSSCFDAPSAPASGTVEPLAPDFWQTLSATCLVQTNRKLQKDRCIGLKNAAEPPRSGVSHPLPEVGISLHNDRLAQVLFPTVAYKHFGIATDNNTFAPSVICLYPVGSV